MSTSEAIYRHDLLVKKVVDFVIERDGWEVVQMGIESLPELSEQLKRDYTPAALYVRTRPDLLARNLTAGASFFLEVKVPSERYSNLACELLPLHVSWSLSHITKTIYCCEGEMRQGYVSFGFLAENPHELFKSFKIPQLISRLDGQRSRLDKGWQTSGHIPAPDTKDFYHHVISLTWPDKVDKYGMPIFKNGFYAVTHPGSVKGSGDPYAMMGCGPISRQVDWRELLTDTMCAMETEAKDRRIL